MLLGVGAISMYLFVAIPDQSEEREWYEHLASETHPRYEKSYTLTKINSYPKKQKW